MDETKCSRLICDIGSGDTDALRELYDEKSKAVFSYALSIVRNVHLAEDVTQDVFVKIKLGAGKYKAENASNGWILKLTKNTALDALKKQNHETPVDLFFEETPDCGSDDIEDTLLLKYALQKLTKTERQIVMLYLVAGLSQKEIANQLHLPVTTINWKYRSGLKKLALILE